MIGSYVAGHSPVHRAPAGLKLLVLLAAGATVVLLDRPVLIGGALLVVLAAYALARLPGRTPWAQVRPLLWLLGFTVIFHLVVTGWGAAVVVVGRIMVLVLLAGLITLTTRTTALIEVVVRCTRPLARFGVDPERVGLMLALGIRCVPLVVGLAEEVRDAQRARGLTASPAAFAVPLVVRSLRRADALGEALVARGVDDDQ